MNLLLGLDHTQERDVPLPPALEEFRRSPDFEAVVEETVARWRGSRSELERDWLRSLAGIRVGRRRPRSSEDYKYVCETIRRVLT